jgi:hypothetical protein
MPVGLDNQGDEAIAALDRRESAPRVLIRRTEDNWQFECPYAPEDEERWFALLFQAFGTRHGGVFNAFFDAFVRLCGDRCWDEERHVWMPDEDEFSTMLALVASHKPENEAQAAHAVQLAAVHLVSMKLGEQALKGYWDVRTAATFAKLVRVYGDGIERMARLQGKIQPRTVNQTIKVVYVDSRDQRSVQIKGGTAPVGGQPHGTDGSEAISCSSLPSPGAIGPSVSITGSERQTSLPLPWWSAWFWRAVR